MRTASPTFPQNTFMAKGQVKDKGKVYSRTGLKGPKGEQRYSSTLSLTSALDRDGWSTPRPGRFISGTHCIGGWVCPRAGLYGCGKSRPPPTSQ